MLDGWVPPAGLPPAPAVALIAPPRLPGGAVGGPLGAAPVSSTAAGNDLIRGVDLRSLSVDRDAARRLDAARLARGRGLEPGRTPARRR